MDYQQVQLTYPSLLLYNPSQLPREDLKNLFIARQPVLEELVSYVRATEESPQHHLIIGERGMGKTTLLHRLAGEIEESPGLAEKWLPICFDEEQYNVGGLADLWLNSLDIAAGKTGDRDLIQAIDELRRRSQVESLKDQDKKMEEEAFKLLERLHVQERCKLLFLVDNIDIVLSRLDPKVEARRLREVLINQEKPWLKLIGTSSRPIDATFEYGSPFYELFNIIELRPLDRSETVGLLQGLARVYDAEDRLGQFLARDQDVLNALCSLMGGNLRTVTILFAVLRAERNTDLSTLLTRLLDYHTSDYKDRIEGLPTQGQRVFDALALHWNPATAEQIAERLRIDRGAASAQLHRLVDRGLVRKVQIPASPMGFLVKERFFNIWCLMRGERRNRQRLRSLLGFLNSFHSQREDQRRSFRRLVSLLRYHDLMSEGISEGFAAKIREPEGETQGDLPGTKSREETAILLLSLCYFERYNETKSLVEYLLQADRNPLFAQLVQIYILEKSDLAEEATRLLSKYVEADNGSDWLRIEYVRLLLVQGKSNEAQTTVVPLVTACNLPPEQLAIAALDLARAGGENMKWLAQALVQKAREQAPESFAVLLVNCRMEILLERIDKAAEQLRSILRRHRLEASGQDGFEVLDLVLEMARTGQYGQVLDLLQEAGLAESWLPLAYALEHLEDPEAKFLERLAPELRDFTEQVIARIAGRCHSEPRRGGSV